jgi:choline dehydrogenase-like flavoprotein
MMEGGGGCSFHEMQVRHGKRQSIFRSYVFPYMNRANIAVLTHALVSGVIFEGRRATGVEIIHNRKTQRIKAGHEVVLSLGAIHTPKVLMQSGIGDPAEFQRLGIPSGSISREWGKTFRITLVSVVSGSIHNPLPGTTTPVKQLSFGRLTHLSTLLICSLA